MKVRLSLRLLTIAALCCSTLCWGAQATPTSSAPFQNRDQQQNLPPEKRRSLSNYGPEDVFPNAREQDEQGRSGNRSSRTRGSARPTPTARPSPTAAAAAVTPTPPAPGAANPGVQPLSARSSSSSGLVTAILSTATLFVLVALVYVLGRLKRMLRAS